MTPTRTCVGCRNTFPATELVRISLDPDGDIVVGRLGSGRGAWLCRSAQCLARCSGDQLDRALRKKLGRAAHGTLVEQFKQVLASP